GPRPVVCPVGRPAVGSASTVVAALRYRGSSGRFGGGAAENAPRECRRGQRGEPAGAPRIARTGRGTTSGGPGAAGQRDTAGCARDIAGGRGNTGPQAR